jgi:hypothetical protein
VNYSIDTEFFFMAKGGTHATNQRISIGGKVVLKMKDGSYRMLSPLLEGDHHVVVTDALTQARAKDLPVREKPSASWSKTIHLHPENNEVLKMSEAEAITDFVGWLVEVGHVHHHPTHHLLCQGSGCWCPLFSKESALRDRQRVLGFALTSCPSSSVGRSSPLK